LLVTLSDAMPVDDRGPQRPALPDPIDGDEDTTNMP
jgi:hypothetical protein